MTRKITLPLLAVLAVGGLGLGGSHPVQAGSFNPMDMMNPSKMFGGERGRNDRYDGPPPYPTGGPGYYGAGPYDPGAYPWGGGYGPVPPGGATAPSYYGVPPTGAPGVPNYGAPPATYPGAPGLTAPAPAAPSTPATSSGPSKAEMADRSRQLEDQVQKI